MQQSVSSLMSNAADARVLLVDDEEELLEELREGLAYEGLSAVCASSAVEALELLRNLPNIQFVVTDLNMSGIDGLELLNKISGLGRSRGIVSLVMTGMSSLERAVLAMRNGAVDFLQKPVTALEIAKAIGRLDGGGLERRAAETRGEAGSRAAILNALMKSSEDRIRIFGSHAADAGSWQMMLELAAGHERGESIPTTSLCLAAGIPATTALRRLEGLEELGLVERFPDPADRRRVLVGLTPTGHAKMLRYLERFGDRFTPAGKRSG